MNAFKKVAVPLLSVAMLAFAGLWLKSSVDTRQLSRELQRSRDDVLEKESLLQGLEQANARLQARLREIPLLTVTGESAQTPPSDLPPMPPSMEWDVFMEEPQEEAAPDADVVLTPEQQAEAEAREQRREERAQAREEARVRITDELQARREFFAMINTDGLAPEYAEANQRLVEAMGEMQLRLEQIANPELSREERRELGREMWQANREIRDLMDLQKDVLLYDYAGLELGLNEERTQQFLDYMKTVETFTTMPRMGRGGRR